MCLLCYLCFQTKIWIHSFAFLAVVTSPRGTLNVSELRSILYGPSHSGNMCCQLMFFHFSARHCVKLLSRASHAFVFVEVASVFSFSVKASGQRSIQLFFAKAHSKHMLTSFSLVTSLSVLTKKAVTASSLYLHSDKSTYVGREMLRQQGKGAQWSSRNSIVEPSVVFMCASLISLLAAPLNRMALIKLLPVSELRNCLKIPFPGVRSSSKGEHVITRLITCLNLHLGMYMFAVYLHAQCLF